MCAVLLRKTPRNRFPERQTIGRWSACLAPNPSAAMGDADRLPMANVSRIVQNALPKDSAIAKEARVALSACATVFVHYVTELAVQQCDKRKKLTLTPDDILEALREAEFDGAASVCLPAIPLRARAPPAQRATYPSPPSEFDAPMREALQKFRSGGGAAKKGGGGHKKQKLDDGADNGEDTPTKKEDQEVMTSCVPMSHPHPTLTRFCLRVHTRERATAITMLRGACAWTMEQRVTRTRWKRTRCASFCVLQLLFRDDDFHTCVCVVSVRA